MGRLAVFGPFALLAHNQTDNNAGQGKAGTDRSNIVVLHEPVYAEVGLQTDGVAAFGHWGNSYPYTAAVNASNFLGLSRDDLILLATQTGASAPQFGGNMKQVHERAFFVHVFVY